MILFNKKWIENQSIVEEAKRWHISEIISKDQYESIKTCYATPFYTPTLLIRILLFIFTYITLSGVGGILLISLQNSGNSTLASTGIILGMLLLVLLEYIITHRKLYKSGFEEACLYMALWGIIGGFLGLYFDTAVSSEIIPWMIPLPFLIWGVVRFADPLTTAATYVCFFAILFFFLKQKEVTIPLPFILMTFSALAYFGAHRLKRYECAKPYRGCLSIIEALDLFTFYAASNYFVVSKTNILLIDFFAQEGNIFWVWLFYVLTFLIPLTYIILGLIRRDSLLLRMGLFTSALSALTFRYYFHLLPPEVILTLSGAFLFVIAACITRLLNVERKGFTSQNILREKSKGANVEGWLIGSTLHTTLPNQAKPFESGGGKFGGGGTGGNW